MATKADKHLLIITIIKVEYMWNIIIDKWYAIS